MLFMLVLVIATAAATIVRRHSSWRERARVGMAIAMVVAGASHLAQPDPFVQHLPEWVAWRHALVAVSGVAEIVFGAVLLRRRSAQKTGRLLAGYLIAVFP